MILEADNILLRKLETKDATRLQSLGNNKKIADNMRDIFPHPYTPEDANNFIKLNQGKGFENNFAIIYKDEFAGMVGVFSQPDVYRKSVEIGYWLGEPHWGKGIASSCIKLLVEHVFSNMDVVRIYATVFEYNQASMRVLEKNNFTLEGISRKAIYKKDQYWDAHLYGLLKEDFK